MDRDAEVRIYILGDERELRPLSAGSLLEAMRESRTLLEEYGGSVGIIEGACVVARGLFAADGTQLFADGREALETMTAEEIDMAAAEYAVDIGMTRDNVLNDEAVTGDYAAYDMEAEYGGGALNRGETVDHQEASERVTGVLPEMPYPEKAGANVFDTETLTRYRVKEGESREQNKAEHRELPEREALEKTIYTTDVEKRFLRRYELLRQSVAGKTTYITENVGDGRNTVNVQTNAEPWPFQSKEPMPDAADIQYTRAYAVSSRPNGQWRDMEGVSDFFERDSRRYDSSVKLY